MKGLPDSGITSIPRILVHPTESPSDTVSRRSRSRCSTSPGSTPHRTVQSSSTRSNRPRRSGVLPGDQPRNPALVLNDTVSAVKDFHELPREAKAKHYRRLGGWGSGRDVHEQQRPLPLRRRRLGRRAPGLAAAEGGGGGGGGAGVAPEGLLTKFNRKDKLFENYFVNRGVGTT